MAVLIPPLLTDPGGSADLAHIENAQWFQGGWQAMGLPIQRIHIRNRTQAEVSGEDLAHAWLRPGAEAGGKCPEQDGGPVTQRLSQAG